MLVAARAELEPLAPLTPLDNWLYWLRDWVSDWVSAAVSDWAAVELPVEAPSEVTFVVLATTLVPFPGRDPATPVV